MLHEFLTTNRASLVQRCHDNVKNRFAAKGLPADQEFGIPMFLDQIIKTLEAEEASDHAMSFQISGGPHGDILDASEIGATAKSHAQELSRQGFTFDEVVRCYGDICQAITSLAIEDDVSIDVTEFLTLNRCLDNATANAVTEFAYQQELKSSNGIKVLESQEHIFALQVQSRIQSAQHALSAIKSGKTGLNGVTGAKLDELLESLRTLANRKLSSLSITPKVPAEHHKE